MMHSRNFVVSIVLLFVLINVAQGQGDVRSATGMPIPIGAAVIWGQVELKGLKPNEQKPSVFVTLLFNGAQLGRVQANDKGYYYFLQRARDGASLLVTVGGVEIGSQNITSAGGDRYDMAVNWTGNSTGVSKPAVVSVRDAYPGRSPANVALMERAAAQAKAKNSAEAIKIYSQVVSSDPNDFVAFTELGSLYFANSKHAEAEKAYKEAVDLKPDFTLTLLNLGKLYLADKKFPEAVLVLENAVMSDKSSADSLHYLGEAYLQNKQGSKAVAVLNEAIRLEPDEKADIHLRLGALYNNAGMKDRAANEYRLFLQKRPEFKEKSKLEAYIKDNGK